MSYIRKLVGIDGVDLLIQAGVTGFLMIVADTASHNDAGVAIVGAVSMLVLGLRRYWALRHRPPETTGEVAAERIADFEARLAEMDQANYRIQELEERLDFAERLLAQTREQERLS